MSDLVSVVVPTHNRGHLLPRLLSCLLAQDIDDFEVVVVVDGSSDDTDAVLAAQRDPRVRAIRHDRARGVSAARNAGTRAARGKLIAWCDDDDVWAPYKLRLQREALERSPAARWCNGGAVLVDAQLQVLGVQLCPPAGDVSVELQRTNRVTGGGSGVMADRELALALGGFDSGLSIYADWYMWARFARAAPLAVVDAPLVGYVAHPGGMSHDRRRLLAEFGDFQEAMSGLAGARDECVDVVRLGGWMLHQQASDGRLRETALLGLSLLRRRMAQPRRVAYSLVRAAAPLRVRRRWTGSRIVEDPRRLAYRRQAEQWLAEARHPLPAHGPAPAAGLTRGSVRPSPSRTA